MKIILYIFAFIILAISPSGYIENENSGSGQTNVVEIIKSGIDKIGKSE
jgi:hypothetical protein